MSTGERWLLGTRRSKPLQKARHGAGSVSHVPELRVASAADGDSAVAVMHPQPEGLDRALQGAVPRPTALPADTNIRVDAVSEDDVDPFRDDLARREAQGHVVSEALGGRVGREWPSCPADGWRRLPCGRRWLGRHLQRLASDRWRCRGGRSRHSLAPLGWQNSEINREKWRENGPGDQNGGQSMHVRPRFQPHASHGRREWDRRAAHAVCCFPRAPSARSSRGRAKGTAQCVSFSKWSGA